MDEAANLDDLFDQMVEIARKAELQVNPEFSVNNQQTNMQDFNNEKNLSLN